jgi:hypothetical protein
MNIPITGRERERKREREREQRGSRSPLSFSFSFSFCPVYSLSRFLIIAYKILEISSKEE